MESREQSEWNGAAQYLDRINQALVAAAEAAINLDLYRWLHSLKLFYREISSVMKKEEKAELYQSSKELSEKVNKHLKTKAYNKLTPINTQLVEELELYEIKLRGVFKESGLQLKLQDDAGRSLK